MQFFCYLIFILIAPPEVMKITRHTVPNFFNFTSSLLMLFFVQPLSGNSVITNEHCNLYIHTDFSSNFVFFAERHHVDRQCGT